MGTDELAAYIKSTPIPATCLAFQSESQTIRVSIAATDFVAHASDISRPHLIKLHGSIDTPDSIVLTRSDYALSRKARAAIYEYLGHQLRYTSFLFIGFSLTDPNFNLIHDEARLVMGTSMPVSYVVQGSSNAIKEAYLRSRGMNTISLDSWEELPQFFRAINP
jgi:hypothetical protein